MSFRSLAWAYRQRGITPAAKIVLLCLADHLNEENMLCFPSRFTIADRCELSERSVTRHLKELEDAGLIAREDGKTPKTNAPCTYYTLIGAMDDVVVNASPEQEKPAEPKVPLSTPESAAILEATIAAYTGVRPAMLDDKQYSDFFKVFWLVYPKKVALGQAWKAWKKGIKDYRPEEILTGAMAYSKMRKGEDPQYTAHPATWLNGKRWQDEADTPQKSAAERWFERQTGGDHAGHANDSVGTEEDRRLIS